MCGNKITNSCIFILGMLLISGCGLDQHQATVSNDLVYIPAGWFIMGENDERPSNRPQRRVYLDAYAIQKTEVTRGEYTEFIHSTGYNAQGWQSGTPESTMDLPMTNTLWQDAAAYCEWLGMRLPTEAEWEKAARGVDGRRYPWGETWDPKNANTGERESVRAEPVGSFPLGASPYGLLDMCGNAAEWVADAYARDYYQEAPNHNPTGPDQVLDHVIRGGSYDDPPEWTTTYFRNSSHSAHPNPRVGFRCADSIDS